MIMTESKLDFILNIDQTHNFNFFCKFFQNLESESSGWGNDLLLSNI